MSDSSAHHRPPLGTTDNEVQGSIELAPPGRCCRTSRTVMRVFSGRLRNGNAFQRS